MSRPRAATPPRRICVLVLALAWGGCGSSAKSEEGALEPVRVSVSRHFTNAPLLLAKEAGFFEEEGLALEILDTFGNTSQLVPALSQGRIDVLASAVSIGLLNAIGREGAIRLVADKGHYAPEACSSVAIVARRGLVPPGTPVGPELFRGRRFAMGDVASGSRYFFEAMLDSLGLQEG
ncbi:MAG: ABC transporter substrate-binding protein, partial [Gaiellaceae bacterium]